jgi:hypothetical protein
MTETKGKVESLQYQCQNEKNDQIRTIQSLEEEKEETQLK